MSESAEPNLHFAKLLLEQRGTIWLFKITEGERVTFSVERSDRILQFSHYPSARAKFELELLRQLIGPEGGPDVSRD
jgi:hypothetical protein